MNGLRKVLLSFVLFSLAGCAEGSSTDRPPLGEFPFPGAVAVHPAGYALVATTNFDMRYQSGLLQAVDLRTLGQRIEAGTAGDTDNSDLILTEQAITIPSFAGNIELAAAGDRGLAVVSCRQTNQLLFVDMLVDQDAEPGEGLRLSCWAAGEARDGQAPPSCQGSRYVLELDHDDPFGLLMLPGHSDEQTPWEERSWSVWVSYLRNGMLSEVEVPAGRPDPQEPPRTLREVESESEASNGLAYSPVTRLMYASARFNAVQSNPLRYFYPEDADDPVVYTVELFNLLLGNETRGLAFAPDGLTLAVLVRDPDQLAFLDTTPGPDGRPRHQVLGQVVLEDNPARLQFAGELVMVTDAESDVVAFVDGRTRRLVEMREDICRGPYDVALWQPPGRTLGLVACFEEDVLAVVDIDPTSPDFLQVLAKVGRVREEP